ncbi:hypothetical protein L218DRAFT_476201 [Marasmius fiardii PR-910]|nr:hypothetical protein L218DRAFT_476201 [Marasmius fiardii PR-910]
MEYSLVLTHLLRTQARPDVRRLSNQRPFEESRRDNEFFLRKSRDLRCHQHWSFSLINSDSSRNKIRNRLKRPLYE